MPDIPVMRSKDFLKCLLRFGCEEIHVRGSHHKLYYPETGLAAPVAVHGGKDITKAVFIGTLKQLGIDVDEFLAFIKKN
ncbi:MAG: type II toxin-antitoxin system HicA family toxin [Oscillospiraceae bacterium]|nr:type II toxin-antitoxin system HicA family toxin [Oscillospiraceae bacterium]